MANVYCSSARHAAVAQWAATTAYVSTSNGGRGDYVRQLAAPAVNSERVFRCTTSGTSDGAEPSWTLTKNATTNDGTAVWTECTGQEADQVSGTWRAPHARKFTALAATWWTAGDTLYTGSDHAETTSAALVHTYPGTLAAPDRDICVLVTGTVPPVSADLRTTATVTTTGNSGLTLTGSAYIYGTIFSCASGAFAPDFTFGGTTLTDLYLHACAVRQGGTSGGRAVIGSSSASIGVKITWDNTTYQVAAAGATIQIAYGVDFLWKNTATAVTGATIPTNLFGANAQGMGTAVIDGVDLIALSTKTLVAAQTKNGTFFFKDCKLPAAVTISTIATNAATNVYVTRSAAGATAYTLEKHNVFGDQTTEVTIVRTGGASVNGTPVAMKIVATANAKFQEPFVSTPLVITNTTTGSSVTVTVYGIWAGGAVPNTDEVWMEVGYLGSAATPQLTFNSGTKADILATAAAQAADAVSTWGGSTTAFKLVTTLSAPQPQLEGEMYIAIKSASTNATYIDPLPVLS